MNNMLREHNSLKLLALSAVIASGVGGLAPVQAQALTIQHRDGSTVTMQDSNVDNYKAPATTGGTATGSVVQSSNPMQKTDGWTYPAGKAITSIGDIGYKKDGQQVTGWFRFGAWRYFDTSGRMVSGWQQIDGKWYFFEPDGTMIHGYYVDGYHLGTDGAWDGTSKSDFSASDNVYNPDTFKLFIIDDYAGSTASQFTDLVQQGKLTVYTKLVYMGKTAGEELHFKLDNYIVSASSSTSTVAETTNPALKTTGWTYPAGKAITSIGDIGYKKDGQVFTGWMQGGFWRYFDASSRLVSGWQQIDSKWYFFCPDGTMLMDYYVDGYHLGNSGAWDGTTKSNFTSSDNVYNPDKMTRTIATGYMTGSMDVTMSQFASYIQQGKVGVYTKTVYMGQQAGEELHFYLMN